MTFLSVIYVIGARRTAWGQNMLESDEIPVGESLMIEGVPQGDFDLHRILIIDPLTVSTFGN